MKNPNSNILNGEKLDTFFPKNAKASFQTTIHLVNLCSFLTKVCLQFDPWIIPEGLDFGRHPN